MDIFLQPLDFFFLKEWNTVEGRELWLSCWSNCWVISLQDAEQPLKDSRSYFVVFSCHLIPSLIHLASSINTCGWVVELGSSANMEFLFLIMEFSKKTTTKNTYKQCEISLRCCKCNRGFHRVLSESPMVFSAFIIGWLGPWGGSGFAS